MPVWLLKFLLEIPTTACTVTQGFRLHKKYQNHLQGFTAASKRKNQFWFGWVWSSIYNQKSLWQKYTHYFVCKIECGIYVAFVLHELGNDFYYLENYGYQKGSNYLLVYICQLQNLFKNAHKIGEIS